MLSPRPRSATWREPRKSTNITKFKCSWQRVDDRGASGRRKYRGTGLAGAADATCAPDICRSLAAKAGQNLIGSEQGDLLGLIRTQELLAARRIDGAQQFFTRAIDFGYTKTASETLSKWGHDRILSDVVWTIRSFRPDVIILRFSGTARDGHGQHQVSAMLGKEAFAAAADPKRFPEQLQYVRPWQAKRVFWNVFRFTRNRNRKRNG